MEFKKKITVEKSQKTSDFQLSSCRELLERQPSMTTVFALLIEKQKTWGGDN